jgi:DNA-binding GntR family transcriptional regulator
MGRYPNETMRDYALRILRDNIISLNLEPGSILSEKALGSELGMSRTPIREALQELSKSRIVEILPQMGTIVSLIDYSLIEEAFFLRQVLEAAVVTCAAALPPTTDFSKLDENIDLQNYYLQKTNPEKFLKLDNDFHLEIFRLCNKEQSFILMHSMNAHYERVRRMSLDAVKDSKIVQDHTSILNAIKNKDQQEAKAAMEKHISRYELDKEAIHEKYAHYFK